MNRLFCGLSLALISAHGVLADQVSTFSLANGMQAIVIEDHRAPVVTNMVWYRAGSADEQRGKSGIAHFLEHLMFKGTKTVATGDFSKIVEANGGYDNAFTSTDMTAYHQRLAADRLELVMKMEADRMRNLVLSEEDVTTEREVILEERSQRIDSQPEALFSEQLSAAQYLNHPYGVPIIGWRSEMEHLSRQDALDWYQLYYAPNNATLIVEKNGNFEMMIEPTDTPAVSDAEVGDEELIRRATDIAGQLSVLNGQPYRVGMIRDTKESGGFEGFTDNTRTVEKTVIIDQTIDGVPFIDPEAGHLEVTFDARNGQAKRVRSSLRRVTTAIESSENAEETSLEQVRRSAIQRFAGSARSGARTSAQSLEVVPESEEIGYQMIDGKAVPVYRALIKDPNFTLGRPQMALIPLVKSN